MGEDRDDADHQRKCRQPPLFSAKALTPQLAAVLVSFVMTIVSDTRPLVLTMAKLQPLHWSAQFHEKPVPADKIPETAGAS